MRRRRLKRRLFWATVLLGFLLLALVGMVVQLAGALTRVPSRLWNRLGTTSTTRRRHTMRKLVLFGALVLVVGIAVGGGTLASASPVAQAQTMTLTTVDIPKSEKYVDVGAKGESVGDTVVLRETLLRDAKKAGTVSIMCVASSRSSARCWGTLRLPGGTLDAAADIVFAKTFSLPVIGGTGTYAGAKGELTITQLTEKKDRYVIDLAG